MSAEAGGRYRFPPLERRGLVAGITGTQLAVAAGGAGVALLLVRVVPSPAGLFLAVTTLTGAGAGATWSVGGRTPAGWLPVGASWLLRRSRQPVVSDLALVGTTHAGPAKAVPPPALLGVELHVAPEELDAPPVGVVHDVKTGLLLAVVAVRGRSFSLLDPAEKHRRLDAWGAVLAALCRDGSPVRRVQWIERATPADRDGLRRYLDGAGPPLATEAARRARQSYSELIGEAGPVGHAHVTLLAVAVDVRKAARAARAAKAAPMPGGARAAACSVLRRELRLLQGQLRNAELTVDRVLSPPEVAAAFRGAFDPATAPAGAQSTAGATKLWPLASDERWGTWRTDGSWHSTYWIAEWPRVEVGPDFLGPLLLAATGSRAVSVVMAPVPPARAAREVEAARTAEVADEKLREKAGFLTTARRQREADGVLRREAELADGHAEYRFSGYVTLSAPTEADLDTARAEIEQAARHANLELRLLYGQQAEAFTWTLPLGRGLR